MKEFDTIILGGGASGCMCALSCNNGSVAIIDNNNKIAKKLLVTGNGRCNITNQHMESSFFNTNIDNFLCRFNYQDTLNFFEKLGLVCYHDEEGRFYPLSNSAKSVTEVIENALEQRKVKLFLNQSVIKIEKKENKFLIKTSQEDFICSKLVLALGKYDEKLLANFKFDIKKSMPSLVAIKANVSRGLINVKVKDVLVKAYLNNGTLKIERGEVLFRENGLSGIVIFNLSSLFARNKNFEGKIIINLLPKYDKKALLKMLKARTKINLPLSKFFDGLFVRPIGYEILTRARLNENKNCSDLTKEELEILGNLIQNLEFKVLGHLDNSQLTSGGLDLNNFSENLEAKNIANLYACGEICDVDGLCGGYNLQWAWTSGYIVGQSL